MHFSRKNTIYFLSGLLVLQIIILSFLYIFSFQSNKVRKINKTLIPNISEKTISNLQIADYLDSFNVKKDSIGWVVQNKDGNIMIANTEKLHNYIADLAKINTGMVVATANDEIDTKYGFELIGVLITSISSAHICKYLTLKLSPYIVSSGYKNSIFIIHTISFLYHFLFL